ncbi:MAG: hypothetical protein C7K11_06755 [Candidatus Amulumruptor caecigallinarius]|uniref:Uncharacterized protein n=1 Tax=Candidatus Amulumruptor caecigallinarius TaxID=2109911 RepID=A0A4Q0U830_9BACT|nr:MAG: hypothetical protein C7K11_06755 [Candidatus Amulumruptor caecigallinarius]HJE38274.1 hypothetical protein [Candidatus Amulumruptor caecigallinarius]
MNKRTKRLWLRVSDDEMELIKRKSAKYDSVSSMIRTAVMELDDRTAAERLSMIDRLIGFFTAYDNRLSWAGSNLNQLTKRANESSKAGLLPSAFFSEILMPELQKLSADVAALQKSIDAAITKTISMKK